jgi:predicted dehydrogenase
MHRIAPGQRNTWYLEILGTTRSMRWSSANPKLLEQLDYRGGSEQTWQQIQTGYEPAFKSITGSIFEFGFTDAILQMWASYLYELSTGKPLGRFSGCVTPAETMLSHRLFTAALESHERCAVVEIKRD